MTETSRMSQISPHVKHCAKNIGQKHCAKNIAQKTLGEKTNNFNRLLCWFHNLHSATVEEEKEPCLGGAKLAPPVLVAAKEGPSEGS